MKIRLAEKSDIEILSIYDKHIRITELGSAVSLGRVIVTEDNGRFIGWLRWNLFWDNTPFMNMLFILDRYRSCGYGRKMVAYWEKQMKTSGYDLVVTSSLANEAAQHDKYGRADEYDIFITHRNWKQDFEKMKQIGVEAYNSEQVQSWKY